MSWSSPFRRQVVLSLIERDGFECIYCGNPFDGWDTITLDHVIPKSRGGDNRQDNLVLACARCNGTKAADLYFVANALIHWRARCDLQQCKLADAAEQVERLKRERDEAQDRLEAAGLPRSLRNEMVR